LQLAGGYSHREDREPRADALARRARLRGTQRRAWPRPLRRERLARIPSSRCFMHRRLRVPHSRASSAFPPTPSILPPTGSPTRRFPPEGKSQCDLSATTPRLSRRFALSLPVRSLEHFHVAPAAGACDTVVLDRAALQLLLAPSALVRSRDEVATFLLDDSIDQQQDRLTVLITVVHVERHGHAHAQLHARRFEVAQDPVAPVFGCRVVVTVQTHPSV